MPYYRKCPQCGYVDPVAWITSYYDMEREIADIDEFRAAYPELAARLESEKDVLHEGFVYRFGKPVKGMRPTKVMRLPEPIFKARGRFYPPKGYYDSLCHRFPAERVKRHK